MLKAAYVKMERPIGQIGGGVFWIAPLRETSTVVQAWAAYRHKRSPSGPKRVPKRASVAPSAAAWSATTRSRRRYDVASMTHHHEDTRAIEATHEQYNATLVRRVDETDELAYFWVRFNGEPTPFEPGQYMTTGVVTEGKMLQRPYSVASSPRQAEDGYELYVRLVPVNRFTTALWRLPIGHEMRMIGPKGKFLLEPDDERTHLFASTGTGIAPFISMMRTLIQDGQPRPAVVLHGVSYRSDLGYKQLLEDWRVSGEYPVTYIPTISRPSEPANAGWQGRTGRVEANVLSVCDELGLTRDNAVVYICGNPEMIVEVEAQLHDRGFAPEDVKKELYWPKARPPRPAEVAAPAG
jgi:ferredoxin--NADP+ reductase